MHRVIPPEALKRRISTTNSKDLAVVIPNLNEAKILISDPKNWTKGCFSFIHGDSANGEYIACAMGALEGTGVAKAAYVYPVLGGLLEPDYELPLEHNYLHQAMLSMERAFDTYDESHRLSN
ncbi:hypothetical protein OA099_01130 [Litorivicinus sp.]|nr:hypothetical protein [Litorivicinus sp.]